MQGTNGLITALSNKTKSKWYFLIMKLIILLILVNLGTIVSKIYRWIEIQICWNKSSERWINTTSVITTTIWSKSFIIFPLYKKNIFFLFFIQATNGLIYSTLSNKKEDKWYFLIIKLIILMILISLETIVSNTSELRDICVEIDPVKNE